MADAWFFISGMVVGGLAVFLVNNTILKGAPKSEAAATAPAKEEE